jgi:hypothetical protein
MIRLIHAQTSDIILEVVLLSKPVPLVAILLQPLRDLRVDIDVAHIFEILRRFSGIQPLHSRLLKDLRGLRLHLVEGNMVLINLL